MQMDNNTGVTEKLEAGIKILLDSSCGLSNIVKLCSVVILLLIFITTNAGMVNAQTFAFKFGSIGSGDGQFFQPSGVAVDGGGNIYVADTGNNRIQKLNQNGSVILQFGTRGTGDSQFDSPSGVAVDRAGNIYVADSGNNRIQKLNQNGNLVLRFGTRGDSGWPV
jgi:DNA-binding beta-propeller fold protein YncE